MIFIMFNLKYNLYSRLYILKYKISAFFKHFDLLSM